MYSLDKFPEKERLDNRFFTWNEFLAVGKEVKTELIDAKMRKQKPGNCCALVYTSGTTGNPKGVMLSHDNLNWTETAIYEQLA